MIKTLRANCLLTLSTFAICAIAFPAVMFALGRTLLPSSSAGSLVDDGGTVKGSRLIGQPFSNDEYFWPRPSAAGNGYNALTASGSNWGANNPKLRDRVSQQLGPMVVYKKGSRSGADGRTPQQDIEAWFAAAPDRVASWASDTTIAPVNWAKTDLAGEKYGLQGQYIAQWAKDHPDVVAEWKKANADKTEEPKPEDLAPKFFASFAKLNPGKWPGVVESKQPDGSVAKRIEPVASDSAIHANFFDLWLSAPANAAKVADLEPVVADMVMASGSGLDPHITARNALSVYQLDRVAGKRSSSPIEAEKVKDSIAALIRNLSFTPLAGLVGEPLVNELELNRELDARFPIPAK